MSIFEYDEEKELKLIRELEYQEGVRQGIEQGIGQGIQQSILNLAAELGPVTGGIKEQIQGISDTGILQKLLKCASRADTMEAFLKEIDRMAAGNR